MQPAFSPSSDGLPMYSPNIITQEAINFITVKVWRKDITHWMQDKFLTPSPTQSNQKDQDVGITHFYAPVVHPVTGKTITKNQKLTKDPVTRNTWSKASGK